MMSIIDWIVRELEPRACDSTAFIYDDMDSQSGQSLPIIYQPFNAGRQSHWRDRGALFDYLFSTEGDGKRILDFGPGDGWPSLILAPFVDEIVGVDGSWQRVEVCTKNAARLNVTNARFVYVAPDGPLPFEDKCFDAVVAASSLEQTPNPRMALSEVYRVLRMGGRLRLSYEGLAHYRGGQEQDLWLWPIDNDRCRLILFDRRTDEEYVVQYGLTFGLAAHELTELLSGTQQPLTFEAVSIASLETARSAITDARVCITIHPSGRTWASWLSEVGFRQIIPSHGGGWMAEQLFEQFTQEHRPQDLASVDAYLRPIIRVVVRMRAPLETDPMITAIK